MPAQTALGQAKDLNQQFLAVYEPGVKPLVDFYENVEIRYKSTRIHPQEKPITSDLVYFARAPLFRLDDHKGSAKGTVRHFTYVADPSKTSFSVFRGPGQERNELTKVSTDYADKMDVIRQFSPIPSRQYCTANVPISEAVKARDPRFTIKAFDRLERDGEQLARIDFVRVYEEPGKPDQVETGWILFAPQDCWAVREARAGSEYWLRCSAKYNGLRGRVPLVTSLEMWWEDKDGNKLTKADRATYEVQEIIPGPVPAAEFTLAAFGLSDAGLQAAAPRWFYLQLAAVVALAAAVVFWRLSRRRRETRTTPR
jgi:hypothetical protein